MTGNISTRNLASLPAIETLRKQLQGMAALTAILAGNDGEPGFEFHPAWSGSQQMGAVKNGSGDELFVHFTKAGCFITGFAHESAMSPYHSDPPELWPGLLDDVPAEFASSLKEPAFDLPSTTFVVWRKGTDQEWQTAKVKYPDEHDSDGSHDLLSRIVMSADEFAEWLAEYFEVEVDSDIVEHVFAHEPLANEQLRTLNPSAKLSVLRRIVQETGYPLND